MVWRWDNQEPFGDDTPNEDPGNTGTSFSFPLRFPGQYFDSETNTAYNYYRDYDPAIGRYVQSDPIGLLGGVNTYLYASASPLLYVDALGMYCLSEAEINAIGIAVTGTIAGAASLSEFGPQAAIAGGVLGAGAGAVLGFIGTTSAAVTMTSGGAASGLTSMNNPPAGIVGGVVGGSVQYELEQAGVRDTQAGIVGGGVGGAVGGALTNLMKGTLIGAGKGGAIGLASAAAGAAVIEALRAGNDCGCGKR